MLAGMDRDREGVMGVVGLLAPALLPGGGRWLVAGLLAAGCAAFSPASPLALAGGDLLAGLGRPEAAVAVYDGAARWTPWRAVRRAALERAARTWSIALDDPGEARRRWEALLGEPGDPSQQADALEQLALSLFADGVEEDGILRLREAHDLAPQAPGAARRLERAATAASQLGNLEQADRLWRRLGQAHPDRFAVAELGRADVALRRGRIETALHAYQEAHRHTFDPAVAAAAKFGSSICLERLGDLEEAIADLDEAELPPRVFEERATKMRERLPAGAAEP
jgi:tetratricopeptide (TPR) repeat protein